MPTPQQTKLLRATRPPGERALLSDLFADTQNPLISGPANPGHGARQITSTRLQTLGGRLRGSGQTSSPAWGATKDVYTRDDGTGFPRQNGLAFCVLVTIEDFNDRLAIGWDTATNTSDPRTVGHGFVNEAGSTAGGLGAIYPGKQVPIGATLRNVRSQEYLVVVVLYAEGAVVLLSVWGANDSGDGMNGSVPIHAYPNARVLWVDSDATTSPLYPYISYYDRTVSYPNGHAIEHARIVPVPSWATQDSIAALADRFTRADSSTTVGNSWTAENGTWGISSNQAYDATPTDYRQVIWKDSGLADGYFQWDVVMPGSGTCGFGCVVRRSATRTFIVFSNNFGATGCRFETWTGGLNPAAVFGTTANGTWTNGVTYRITMLAIGNEYTVWSNGVLVIDRTTDSGNNHLSNTQIGCLVAGHDILSNAEISAHRFDNVFAYAHSVALPTEITARAVPYVAVPGATILADTFTDTNSVALASHTPTTGGAWTEHSGTWTIQSNRASVVVSGNSIATQDAGTVNAEAVLDVITPSSFTADWHAGVCLRFTDTSNYMYVVILRTSLQVGSDEVEFHEVIAGVDTVTHKSNVAAKFLTSTTYTLKVQARDDKVYVMLDGKPRVTLITSKTYTGTRWGLFRTSTDEGCVFDNWTVKAL